MAWKQVVVEFQSSWLADGARLDIQDCYCEVMMQGTLIALLWPEGNLSGEHGGLEFCSGIPIYMHVVYSSVFAVLISERVCRGSLCHGPCSCPMLQQRHVFDSFVCTLFCSHQPMCDSAHSCAELA